MEKEIICTVCPRGCHIQVEGERETVRQVTGYICKRGLEYATAEFTHPVRILTTTVKLDGEEHDLLPVRSAKPIPKEKLFACMEGILWQPKQSVRSSLHKNQPQLKKFLNDTKL